MWLRQCGIIILQEQKKGKLYYAHKNTVLHHDTLPYETTVQTLVTFNTTTLWVVTQLGMFQHNNIKVPD